MKPKDRKWPEILGLPLNTLRVQDLPRLEKTRSGSSPTGHTYSFYSGPVSHTFFETISLKAWDHAQGKPNYLQLACSDTEDVPYVTDHLNELLGEGEIAYQENVFWRTGGTYIILTVKDDVRVNIYLDRNAELESATFDRLFGSTEAFLPEEIEI